MEDRGLKPNRVCYTSAITACQRGGEWRKALNIFLKMNSQGPAPDVAVGPDRQTGTAITTTAAWAGADLCTNHCGGDDVVGLQAYNAVMSACANAGEWQMALKVSQC